jgi:rubredoxin
LGRRSIVPSVRDNTKYRCDGCKTIVDIPRFPAPPCPNCGGVDFTSIRVTLVCDFCSGTENVRWVFPCRDFSNPSVPNHTSIGDWAACDECKPLIEAANLNGLATRWLARDPDAKGLPEPMARALIFALHQQFVENRTGPPYLADDDYKEATRDPGRTK